MQKIETYFKGLADTNRLRIINLLLHGELCGCDIQYVIGASQPNVSRHLSYLKKSGLVSDRRVGFRVYYRLVRDKTPESRALITYLHVALRERPFLTDLKRLKQAIKDGACSVSELRRGRAGSRQLARRFQAGTSVSHELLPR